MDRTEKTESIESLKGLFDQAGVVVITHYSGLTVAEMTTLRVRLAEVGAGLKVVKNRLAKIALDGRPGAAASDLFKGPVAIAFSPDPVSAPKVLVEFAKSNDKLQLLGAIMGDSIVDQAGVKALATLPSLDELRAEVIDNQIAEADIRVLGGHLAGHALEIDAADATHRERVPLTLEATPGGTLLGDESERPLPRQPASKPATARPTRRSRPTSQMSHAEGTAR